jgi:hypothetical protein
MPTPRLRRPPPHVSHRELRRRLNLQAAGIERLAAAALQDITELQAAVKNLESFTSDVAAVFARGVWGRLRWVVFGR